MKTELKYLENTYQFEADSVVASLGLDERGPYLTLTSTIFYPQGGGQQCCIGHILLNENQEVNIVHVAFVDGEVRHYFVDANISPNVIGTPVNLFIDQDRRIKNAQLHTVGHLVASVVIEDYLLPWNATKGYHFPSGSYVEFEATQPPSEENELLQMLNQSVNVVCLIDKAKVWSKTVKPDDLLFKEAYLPKNFKPPTDKPLRLVGINGYRAVGCGGTHVSTLDKIRVEVTKMKFKESDKTLRVSYKVIE